MSLYCFLIEFKLGIGMTLNAFPHIDRGAASDGGVYKVSIPRAESISGAGMTIPPAMDWESRLISRLQATIRQRQPVILFCVPK